MKQPLGIIAIALSLLTGAALSSYAQTYSAEACLDSARVAAAADRHADAIRWYHRAIARDSALASQLNLELGHQYTWADKPDSAIGFYRAHLAAHPDDIDGEIGLGRAQAWAGHLKDAIATYRAALPHAGDREDRCASVWRARRAGAMIMKRRSAITKPCSRTIRRISTRGWGRPR